MPTTSIIIYLFCLSVTICHIFTFSQLQSLIPFQQISPNESIKEDYGLGGVDVPKDIFRWVFLCEHSFVCPL